MVSWVRVAVMRSWREAAWSAAEGVGALGGIFGAGMRLRGGAEERGGGWRVWWKKWYGRM